MTHTALAPFETAHLERAHRRQARIELLENQITELAAHIHAATYRLLELIREFDQCEGWSGPGLRSCAHWLNWKCGIGLGAAREKVRVAHALKALPNISDTFRSGEVSYSKVRAITRVATPDNENDLLMIARHGTTAHVERLVRNYRKVKRLEALEKDNVRHAKRELSWYFDDDGSLVLRGRFTPEQGAVITKALESIMDKDFKQHVPAATFNDQTQPESEPIACRRADALVQMAEGHFAGPSRECSSGDRYLVHVHTDIETLKVDGEGAEAEIEDGGCVSAETSRRLSCDAGVVHWLENPDGKPLSVGRKTRTIPPAMRRALKRRDGGCRFPGCTCTRFVDAHHIKHWADGGETRMDNLILLCRRHHRLVHEGGFGIQKDAGERVTFTDPAGEVIEPGPETRFSGNVFTLKAANHQSGIHITPRTGECRWLGERMDDDLAVLGMLQKE